MNVPDASGHIKMKILGMRIDKDRRDNGFPAHMNPVQLGKYYHGTDKELSPGDEISSPNSRGAKMTHSVGQGTGDHTYATVDARMAGHYANSASYGTRPGHVYEVEHQGHLEPDPENPREQVRSERPLRVVRRIST
jgi:hypothetical protein